MKRERAIQKFRDQIDQAGSLKSVRRYGTDFKKWQRDTEIAIEKIFGEKTRHINDFQSISYSLGAFSSATPDSEFQQAYVRGLDRAQAILQSFIDEIEEYGFEEESDETSTTKMTDLTLIEHICNRFNLVARQLRSRYSDRPTLEVEDEYDVQDLFHALLKLHFDDVRPEEYSPSYAGSSSRIDFLLKDQGIVVEIKKTRKNLDAKKVGEELIIDMKRYQNHPFCDTLVCFVYDPEGRIANPRGLENDLNDDQDEFKVIVFVKP